MHLSGAGWPTGGRPSERTTESSPDTRPRFPPPPDTLAEGSPDGSNTCQTCRGDPSRECIQHRCPHLGHHHSQRHHRRHTEQHPDQRSRCPHTECTERETGIEQPSIGQRPHRSSQRDRFSKPIDRRYPGDGEHQPSGYLPEYDGGRFLPFKTGKANRYQDHACDREQIERPQSKQPGQIQPRPVNRLLTPMKHLGPKQKPRDHEKSGDTALPKLRVDIGGRNLPGARSQIEIPGGGIAEKYSQPQITSRTVERPIARGQAGLTRTKGQEKPRRFRVRATPRQAPAINWSHPCEKYATIAS